MVFEKVQEILSDYLEIDKGKIKLESNLSKDLEADSLAVVDLVMSFEDEFQVEIDDEEIENIKTVGDIVSYIEENL